MFCTSCGKPIPEGGVCSCQQQSQAGAPVNSQPAQQAAPVNVAMPKLPSIKLGGGALKALAIVLALVAVFMQFLNLYKIKVDSASKSDYTEYVTKNEIEDELEDYYDDDPTNDYETEKYSLYSSDTDEGDIDSRAVSVASSLSTFMLIAFAVYMGVVLSKGSETLRAGAQGVFFILLTFMLVMVWTSTWTGESYFREGYDTYRYYCVDAGITFSWVVAFLASLGGLVITAFSAKKNK